MTAAEKTAAVQKPKPTKLPDRDFYQVPELASSLGIDPMKILGWIHKGELRALNVAENPNGRPRWRIPAEAWQEFQAARSNQPAPAIASPRRRRTEKYVPTFYK